MGTKYILLVRVVCAALFFTVLHSATAQSLFHLHNFTGGGGDRPMEGSVLVSNRIYGITLNGGSTNYGTIYSVNTNGGGFTNLHHFTGGTGGGNPVGGLTYSGGTLYGTANVGGTANSGTIFSIRADGTGFSNLFHFSASAGVWPRGVIYSNNILYGTTYRGGANDAGVIYSFGPGGYTKLRDLASGEGSHSEGRMLLVGDTLYGTLGAGGATGNGSIFSIRTNGTGFTNLHSFVYSSEGSGPNGNLVLYSSSLYGTTSSGGGTTRGSIFKMNINGTGFSKLYNFSNTSGGSSTNRDGASSWAGLAILGDTLYAVTTYGGTAGFGTLVSIRADGSGFTNLHNFTGVINGGSTDGKFPSGLLFSGTTLYGTTGGGGGFDAGTMFSISLPQPPTPPQTNGPTLRVFRSEANPIAIFVWPTNFAGYVVQSTTNLTPPVAWASDQPAPTIVGGQYRVTSSFAGPQRFFRLYAP